MSHLLNKATFGNVAFGLVTITSYTKGGEQFTLAEFGLSGSLGEVFFLQTIGDTVAGAQGNAAQFVQYAGNGIVQILDPGSLQEIPTTPSMQFSFLVVVTTAAAL